MRSIGRTPIELEPQDLAGAAAGGEPPRASGKTTGISVWLWHPGNDRVFHVGHPDDGPTGGVPLDQTLRRIGPGDRSAVGHRLRAAAQLGESGTMQFRSLDGTRLLSGTFFPLDGDVPAGCLQIIVQDVTEAVEAERTLRENLDYYRGAVELHPEIPWFAAPDGQIIEVGPRWLELVGMTEASALGNGWIDALHPDDVDDTARHWAECLASGAPADVEYRLRLRDGSYRWMRARARARRGEDGNIIRWYGTLEDVHDRKLAETRLRDSEEFSRSVLESSAMAIEVLDAQGRLIFINGPGARIMELDDFEAIKDRPYDSFWPPDVAPAVRYAIAQAKRGETVRRTLYGPTAKGGAKWWDLTVSPIMGADGTVARLLAMSRDVTDAKRSEVEIAAAARRLANVLESTMDSVMSIDSDWRITYMNRRATAFFPGEGPYVGSNFHALFDAGEAEPFFDRYRQAMREQRSIAFEDYLPSAKAWLEVQAYGSNAGLIIFFRDVTERRRAQEQINHLARHDSLTGLPNRRNFHDELGLRLADPAETRQLAVMSVDLDDFKLINDTLGHLAGDALLREVARRLVAAGGDGFVGRLGGDEFALLLPIGAPGDAAETARDIIHTLCEPYRIDGETVEIGASVGIAIAERDGDDADTLLHHADIALYRVKAENGRNFRYFAPEMDQALRERREMKRELGRALQRGELHVVYQPQVEIGSGELKGFEALLRWQSATRGAVPPSLFIPLAEESGLIEEIGAFVLKRATAEAMRWPEGISLAVNLSPAQFRSGAVSEAVRNALEASRLPPERLELEITESVLLDQADGAVAALEALHDLGVRVALDDFGTGYSSLSYLQRFPFDKLKIDRSFISGLPGNGGAAAIVRAIIGLSCSFGTRVTAEGVESAEQLSFLAEEGCDEAQGYLFSQPLPAEQAMALALAAGQPPRLRRSLG